MSNFYDAFVDSNSIVRRSRRRVHIYKGEEMTEDDKQRLEHLQIHASLSVIEERTFSIATSLKIVEFSKDQNEMKKLCNDSFYHCHNLSSINIHDAQKLETIGDRTFYQCEKLTSVQYPSSIRQLGKASFAGCSQVKFIDLSHAYHLKTLEEYTFSRCTAMTTINLPPTVSRVGRGCFYRCKALEVLDIRSTCINEIGPDAFNGCINLIAVHFPATLKHIEQDCFSDCCKLSSLDLGTTHTERIGESAFTKCENLKTIHFPKTLKCIGNYCFVTCTKLESLDLHVTSIEKIGHAAFYSCSNLTTTMGIVGGDETVPRYNSDDPMQFPASLLHVGKNIFYKCPNLKNRIDNDWVHHECDVNRGGRRFLKRTYRQDNDDGGADKRRDKVYFSSLWPLILYRVLNNMELSQRDIYSSKDDLSPRAVADALRRRASVVYYLMVHGVVADLQSSQ